jgi:hypothetical protein
MAYKRGDKLVSSRGSSWEVVHGPLKGNNGVLYVVLDDEGNHVFKHENLLNVFVGELKGDEKY